ncbi:hypothetical protein AYI70_g3389 [Smittium culicis]|uniref:Uncharacterized protein n=1 Tax=Smittium culicis TaxID=133412 RepID=A0A1R1Y4A4_9FUNG|nr:hypothetical protein AYI70_g3389 [Smittium culicis]
MSNDGTSMQDTTTAPERAMELISRISQLEAQRNPVSDHTKSDIDVDSDNYIVEKSPSRDLLMYPELAESLPGISQDFFKSPITDLERRKFLKRPKLSQHCKCDRICWTHAHPFIRPGFSSHTTQDGAYKASKIPGKAPQIIPSSSKPLFDQKEFFEHIGTFQALAKAVSSTKPHNKKGFRCKRWNKPALSHQNQHGSTQDSQPVQHKSEAQSNNSGYSGNSRSRPFAQRGPARKELESRPPRLVPRKSERHRERNSKSASKKDYRADFASKIRLFLSNVYDTQEIRRVEASSKSEAVKKLPTPNALQNGKFKYSLQDGKKKGLDDKHRFIRCFSPCSNRKILQKTPELHLGLTKLSIPSAAVRTILESSGVHESTSPCSEMGKTERNTNKCILRRSNHLSTFQGRIGNKDKFSYKEAREAGLLNKFRKIELNPITIDRNLGMKINSRHMSLEIPKEKVRDLRREADRLIRRMKTSIRNLASFLGKSQAMAVALFLGRLMTRRLLDLKNSSLSKTKDWSSEIQLTISALENLLSWRDSLQEWNGRSFHPENPEVEVFTDATELDEFGNKCKRIASDHICPETTSNIRSECIGTFRQQNLNSICEETRRNAIPKLTKSFGGTMDTLYSNRNETSTELHTVNTEPSRRAIKADISNRMVAIQENVQHNREEVRNTRCRHVCDKQELPVRQIRHLETESWIYNDERIQSCMEDMEAAILLSSMEFNTKNYSKSPQRKISGYSGDTRMED